MDADSRAYIAEQIAGLPVLARPAAPPLGNGVDLVCLDDINPRLTETDPASVEAIAQDAYHAIITERGTIADARDFGLGTAVLLSVGRTATDLLALGGRIDQELAKDDRIASSATTCTLLGAEDLEISVAITPEDPSLRGFSLILTVTDGEVLMGAINAG